MRKVKYLLTFSLLSCFALLLGVGILSAEGISIHANSVPSTNSLSNQSYDNRSMDGYNATSATGGNYRTNAVNNNRGFDWGWLGLLGLIGLAGARNRNREREGDRA